jgi:hypothetical protein
MTGILAVRFMKYLSFEYPPYPRRSIGELVTHLAISKHSLGPARVKRQSVKGSALDIRAVAPARKSPNRSSESTAR